MAEDRVVELYRSHTEMAAALDRVMLGVSIAVCGYLGQTVEFGPIGLNIETGYLLVMLLFVLSAAFGIRRLERSRDTAKLNIYPIEIERLMKKVGRETPTWQKMNDDLSEAYKSLKKTMDDADNASKYRNMCLIVGLLSYVSLKVAASY
ncbi:hypothetical protein [Stutzerimonas stutzeri]|uniref:hypothetical protein n=1 Tax=Stutzerimonas stutzeri TaxID=316 RepID=UPI00265B6C7E|nr:hypothetical protein [Stutzerimonas stutzeri]MCF6782568.1 hypothetical protein [Stutzerimonas stutzeri]MCF6805673.1 hypothetical protein [Stutzerimonas stutzeri]